MSTTSATLLTSVDGFPAYALRNTALEVNVIPSLGAKIAGLRDLRSGREWLWAAPDRPALLAAPPGSPFEHGSMAGSDECFPTVAPASVEGRKLPDHGSVWTAAWRVDAAVWADGRLLTTTEAENGAFLLERELNLEHDTLRLAYRVTNRSTRALSWLWALHPLLACRPGDRLELPPEVARVRLVAALGLPFAPHATIPWPAPLPDLDFSALSGPATPPWFAKMFTPALAQGRAALANPTTGECLTIRFDPVQLPYLGVWITRGGWQGYDHLALEPTQHPADVPRPLSPGPAAPSLAPGETRAWWVTLRSEFVPPLAPPPRGL